MVKWHYINHSTLQQCMHTYLHIYCGVFVVRQHVHVGHLLCTVWNIDTWSCPPAPTRISLLLYNSGLVLLYNSGLVLLYNSGLVLLYNSGLVLLYNSGLVLLYNSGLVLHSPHNIPCRVTSECKWCMV